MTFDPRASTLDDANSLQLWLHEAWRRGIAREQAEREARREEAAVKHGAARLVPCADCRTPTETRWNRPGKLCPACKEARHRRNCEAWRAAH